MSLQARTLNNENAGVVSRGAKPGEAPAKQVGPTKRKGLSEMQGNKLGGPRPFGASSKTQQPKANSKTLKKKTPFYDEPIESMFLGTEPSIAFRDPLLEQSMGFDLGKDSTWSIESSEWETDYFSRENARFGLSVDEIPAAMEFEFPEPAPALPEGELYLDDC